MDPETFPARHRLECRDLACLRGERIVFRQLSFAVSAGETLRLTGPNGSGKTSLLRLLAGLGRPAAGTIVWDGAATADDLIEHAAHSVARYKLPKAVVFRSEIQRSPSGKADYRWAKAQAETGPVAEPTDR